MQAAAVSSLRTATTGASFRGRLYWPATAAPMHPDTLRFSTAAVTTFLAGVKTYLSGVQSSIAATSANPVLSVWSRKLESSAPVNRVLLGDIPDVQRRRRDQAIESYQTSVWP
jgi:hypothetical protein